MPDSTLFCEQYFFTPDKNYLQTPAIYISWAGHRVCDSSHVIGPRVLDTYKLVFILSGQGYLIQDDNPKILVKANDSFILFPNHRHHYWADPNAPWTITWVAFNGADTLNLMNAVHANLTNYVLRDTLSEGIKKSMSYLIQALADETDTHRLSAVTTLFSVFNKLRLNIKNIQSVSENDVETLASRVSAFIEQNYYMDIDMGMLCSHTHYSRSYLSRTFKSETGHTIQDFLRDTRINKAKNLLLETSLSIQEVASSVGIMDSLYFSKAFRKNTGYSPRDYRNLFTSNS